MLISLNKKRKRKDDYSLALLDDGPKRMKVHAQRKFAQGSNINSPVITPVEELETTEPSKLSELPEPVELLPIKRPNTEDFLTFLCFRGTPILPPNLNFFNTASIVDNQGQVHEIKSDVPKNGPIDTSSLAKSGAGPSDRPFIAFGVRKRADPVIISKQMERKRRHALALQALRRKYQEQKMAKIRAVTISKLSEKVTNRTMIRTNSVSKTEKTMETITRKSTVQKDKMKVISTKHIKVTTETVKTLRPKVKPKMCLRSFRGRFVQQELQFRAARRLPEKEMVQQIEKRRIQVKKNQEIQYHNLHGNIKGGKGGKLAKDSKLPAGEEETVVKKPVEVRKPSSSLRITRSNPNPIKLQPKKHRIVISSTTNLVKPRVLRSHSSVKPTTFTNKTKLPKVKQQHAALNVGKNTKRTNEKDQNVESTVKVKPVAEKETGRTLRPSSARIVQKINLKRQLSSRCQISKRCLILKGAKSASAGGKIEASQDRKTRSMHKPEKANKVVEKKETAKTNEREQSKVEKKDIHKIEKESEKIPEKTEPSKPVEKKEMLKAPDKKEAPKQIKHDATKNKDKSESVAKNEIISKAKEKEDARTKREPAKTRSKSLEESKAVEQKEKDHTHKIGDKPKTANGKEAAKVTNPNKEIAKGSGQNKEVTKIAPPNKEMSKSNIASKEPVNKKQTVEKSKTEESAPIKKEEDNTQKTSQRPSRKTKEAAAIYMEILSHKLVNESKADDDTVSIDSFPELPNVKKTEQRENELKAKAKSKATQEDKVMKEEEAIAHKSKASEVDHDKKTNTKDGNNKKDDVKDKKVFKKASGNTKKKCDSIEVKDNDEQVLTKVAKEEVDKKGVAKASRGAPIEKYPKAIKEETKTKKEEITKKQTQSAKVSGADKSLESYRSNIKIKNNSGKNLGDEEEDSKTDLGALKVDAKKENDLQQFENLEKAEGLSKGESGVKKQEQAGKQEKPNPKLGQIKIAKEDGGKKSSEVGKNSAGSGKNVVGAGKNSVGSGKKSADTAKTLGVGKNPESVGKTLVSVGKNSESAGKNLEDTGNHFGDEHFDYGDQNSVGSRKNPQSCSKNSGDVGKFSKEEDLKEDASKRSKEDASKKSKEDASKRSKEDSGKKSKEDASSQPKQDVSKKLKEDRDKNVKDAGKSLKDAGKSLKDIGKSLKDTGKSFKDASKSLKDVGKNPMDAVKNTKDDAGKNSKEDGLKGFKGNPDKTSKGDAAKVSKEHYGNSSKEDCGKTTKEDGARASKGDASKTPKEDAAKSSKENVDKSSKKDAGKISKGASSKTKEDLIKKSTKDSEHPKPNPKEASKIEPNPAKSLSASTKRKAPLATPADSDSDSDEPLQAKLLKMTSQNPKAQKVSSDTSKNETTAKRSTRQSNLDTKIEDSGDEESNDSDESFHADVKIPRKKQLTRSKAIKSLKEPESTKSCHESMDESDHDSTKLSVVKNKRFTKTRNIQKSDPNFSDSDEEPLSKLTNKPIEEEVDETKNLKEVLLKKQKEMIENRPHKPKAVKGVQKTKEKVTEKSPDLPATKPKRECAKRPQNYLPMFSSSSDEDNFFHGFNLKTEAKPTTTKVTKNPTPQDLSSKDIGRRFGKEKVNMSNEQIEKWLKESALAGSADKKEEEELMNCDEIPTQTLFETSPSIDTEKLKTSLLVPGEKVDQKAVVAEDVADKAESKTSKSPPDRKVIFKKDKCSISRNVNAFSVNNESSIYAFGEDSEEVLSTPFRRPVRRPSSTATSKSEDEYLKPEDVTKAGTFRKPPVKHDPAKTKELTNEESTLTVNLESTTTDSVEHKKPTASDAKIKPEPDKESDSSMIPPSSKTVLKRGFDALEDSKYKVPSSPSASSSSSAKLYKRQATKTKTRGVEVCNPIILPNFPTGGTPQLVEAPTFYPTEKEFQDPIEYIVKIRAKAEQFGICRIIPPSNFKPECKISDDMRFTAYNQYIHKMLHRWGPNFKELMAIKKYLKTQNISLTQAPWIGGMEIDLPRLYQTVQQLGGLKEVIEKKKWSKVSECMKIPKSAQDRVTKLDDIYCKYLLPYDTLSPAEREKLFDEVETEWAKRESKTLSKLRGENTSDNTNGDSDSESDNEAEECIVKGRNIALSAFYRIARNTMSMWFKNIEPTVQEVEQEFWKHVTVRQNHICVHSGSIDSGSWGYGFAVSKNSPFARHAWNLKVLTNNNGSVLRSLGPIMGVTVPTLHVGMVFSACCWYRDPHSLPWIEYLHTGGSKIWYSIPDSTSEQFRSAIMKLVPNICQNKSLWLSSDSAMVPPSLLVDNGVSLCRVVQDPGEYVVVFPKTYTSNVSTGYVVSESVYFAPPSWLRTARKVFDEMRDSCEPSMFSLDRLLVSIVNDSRTNVEVLRQMIPTIQELSQKEKAKREKLKSLNVLQVEALPLPEIANHRRKKKQQGESEGEECEICRMNLFLSMIVDTQEDLAYCLDHAIEQLEKKNISPENCKLLFTYSSEELDGLLIKINASIENKLQKKVVSKFAGMPTLLK